MNLTETIEACKELIEEDIEREEVNRIDGWSDKVAKWHEHLNNLNFIKYETQLQEYDHD
jgi:hypothetical protein